ncbi:uncharacterized protein FRV6_10093 [Fusarium oxysporum]|uniref:Uncharacterized protein n=1 Tax=Fusarium oxysporum TaxID=5507 RepID=A0A2H3TRU0_FUSOX|nr:uncharacterized protein FRV6_10093 [Fusarium oxysporum]
MHPKSSSHASGDRSALLADPSLTMLNKTEPMHLHNVNIRLWELSFQSATAVQIRHSSTAIHFSHSSSPSQSIPSSQSRAQQTTGITESPDEHTNLHGYGSASVSEGETSVLSPLRSPDKDISKDRDSNPRLVEASYAPSAAFIPAIVLTT